MSALDSLALDERTVIRSEGYREALERVVDLLDDVEEWSDLRAVRESLAVEAASL